MEVLGKLQALEILKDSREMVHYLRWLTGIPMMEIRHTKTVRYVRPSDNIRRMALSAGCYLNLN